jgi:hypothetical protein
MMKYDEFQRNHAIVSGREQALETFLKQTYKGRQHKWRHAFNSNSEDALTWSCFDLIASFLSPKARAHVLDEILEDAFLGKNPLSLRGLADPDQVQVFIGKQYTGLTSKESTEVDASVELPGKLIFFEAKLYGSLSLAAPPEVPHDQIAKKLRVGLDSPLQDNREFYFIFLDVAPLDKLHIRRSKDEALAPSSGGYDEKWKSAWFFDYYKNGRNNSLKPLTDALEGIRTPPIESVAEKMGWLTWSDVFKATLRGIISDSIR